MQVNMLDICRESIAIADADRYGLYPWHVQQQGSRLFLALASDGELDALLLRLAKLVHPCANDLHLEDHRLLARVHRRSGDARLEISDQAVAIP